MSCKYVSSVLQKNNNLMKKGSKLIRVNPFFRRLYLIRYFSTYLIRQKSYHNFFKSPQGLDAKLEVFTVLSEEEVQKKFDRKLKKAKKKAKCVRPLF